MFNVHAELPQIFSIVSKKTQKQPPEVFCEKGVLRNFPKFTEKHLCRSLYFNKVAGLALFTEHLWTTASGVVFHKLVILNLPNLDLRSRAGRIQIKWWRQHWMCRKVPNVCRWSWSTKWSGSRINPTKSFQGFNPMMPSVNKMVKHMLKISEQMLQDF